ncbi:hypothetical protein J4480_00610 [Candidatus Woesearchaeota archaeon]|nr:hypothetical protein [Candidatus Woesearchaeota archaeon]
MELKPALKKLEESREFKKWRQKNKSTYFSYAFKILQEMDPDEWQIGFYNKKKDKITTFMIGSGSINVRAEEEIFKKEDTEVHEIQLEKVKLTFDNAIAKANEFQAKGFPKDNSIKTIAILQNIKELGNIWNITYVTEAFNTLNMRIDASTGKVLEHKLSSVFSFRKE